MKTWLKENWFKVGILVGVILGAHILYQSQVASPASRHVQLEACISQAQQKRDELSRDVFQAWVEGRVDSVWKNESESDIQGQYEGQSSECYRLYD